MVSRRGFLGTLLASIVGTAVAPDEILWRPSRPAVDIPVLAPEALVTLSAITWETAMQIARRLRLPVTRADHGLAIGEGGMTQQVGIDLVVPDRLSETGLDRARYVVPMAVAFAEKLRGARWTRMGELVLPRGCDSCRQTVDGVSVRGILADDPVEGRAYLRFDVLGG